MDRTELRRKLAEARIRLRHTEQGYRIERASAEQAVIDAAGGEKNLGTNAESRERALVFALENDANYRKVRQSYFDAQDHLDRVTASLDSALDEVHERRRQTREKLAEALLAVGAAFDPTDTDDQALDAAVDLVETPHADEARGLAMPPAEIDLPFSEIVGE